MQTSELCELAMRQNKTPEIYRLITADIPCCEINELRRQNHLLCQDIKNIQ